MSQATLYETILAGILARLPDDDEDAGARHYSFVAAAKWFPTGRSDGRAPHISKLHRYRSNGVPTPGGGRIRLMAVRYPSGWCTSPRWAAEFLAELTAAHVGQAVEPPPTRTPAHRRRGLARAEREAEALGL